MQGYSGYGNSQPQGASLFPGGGQQRTPEMNTNGWNQGNSGFQNGYPQSTPQGAANSQSYQAYPSQGYVPPSQGASASQSWAAQGWPASQAVQPSQSWPVSQPAQPSQSYPASQGYAPQGYPASQTTPAFQGYPVSQSYPASQSVYPQSQPSGVAWNNTGAGQGFAQGYPVSSPQGYPAGGAGGYSWPGAGNPMAPQSGTGQSYIPRTPYPQAGASGGYPVSEPSQGYPQAGPMPGRQSTGAGYPVSSMPLNGSGYVPQPVPVRKQPFQMPDAILIILSVALLALFGAGLFVPGLSMLRWAFLGIAACAIALFWLQPMMASNKRLCFTIVFGALAAVVLFSAVSQGGAGQTDGSRGGGTAPGEVTTAAPQGSGNTVVDSQSGELISSVDSASAAQATPETDHREEVLSRLQMFFQYWRANQTDEMLSLCMPSWLSSVENTQAALFQLMGNRKIVDEIEMENITGTENDQSRTVTITALIDRNNGKDPMKYRLNVRMAKEGDQWYVDPQSLKSYESAETTDPASITPEPTEEPPVSPNTILYYNLDGGSKYHADPNCKSLHAKYLPMKGTFTYAQINDPPYNELKPCNVCAAPLRK